MDRKIESRAAKRKKWILGVGIPLMLLLLFSFYQNSRRPSSLKADKGRIVINTVTTREFAEFIPVDGVAIPLKTVVIDALESGVVREIFVEDGDTVSEGQSLLRLENTDLLLDLLNKETQVFDLINNIQNTRNSLEQNKVNRLSQLAEAEYGLQEAERSRKNDEKLYAEKVISQQEYLQRINNYNYQKRRKELLQKALYQDSVSSMEQIQQMGTSAERMKVNLDLMRRKNADLTIKAPVSGQLSNFDCNVGETKGKGQNLASIDVSKEYKIRAGVDEMYISRTFIGQQAMAEMDGREYKMEVIKIYPQVTNGKFSVDLKFTDTVPSSLKRGQNVALKLQMSSANKALVINRGGFYQQTGGAWVYVLQEDGQTAVKRTIKTGRQNPDYYEILEGLKEGEKVITSSYESFGEKDKLIIE